MTVPADTMVLGAGTGNLLLSRDLLQPCAGDSFFCHRVSQSDDKSSYSLTRFMSIVTS